MAKVETLRKNAQFATVYEQGNTRVGSLIVLKALPNELGRNRYGFITSKSVGKAVVRNRVRRLLREAARLTPTPPGWDLVFIARKGAATADYRQLESAMKRLLQRARILTGDDVVGGKKKI